MSGVQYGLGLRTAHYDAILEIKSTVDWFEIITENFIDLSSRDFNYLEKIRADYPISLSIGSCDSINIAYLNALQKLIHHVDPILVSDHFYWMRDNAFAGAELTANFP